MKVKVTQSCPTLCNPMHSPWNSLGQNTGVGSLSLLQGNLPNPGIEPRSPTLQADSLPAEPQGKPKNTGVGSLSLLQQIFLTQESNRGLLHCRQILYQLSYQRIRKGRNQIAKIYWIFEKAREFQKNIYFCFLDYAKAFDCVDHKKLWKILKEMEIPDHFTCLLRNLYAGQEATVRTGCGTTDWLFPRFGSKSGKEYVKDVYCHPAYLIYMQSTS